MPGEAMNSTRNVSRTLPEWSGRYTRRMPVSWSPYGLNFIWRQSITRNWTNWELCISKRLKTASATGSIRDISAHSMTPTIRKHVNCSGIRWMNISTAWVSMPGGWMPPNRMYRTIRIWITGRSCADRLIWALLPNISMPMPWWMRRQSMTDSVA